MRVFKLRRKLHKKGFQLHEYGDGWLVTNNGSAKTAIEQEFADLEAVEAWLNTNRLTDAEADEFDEDWKKFVIAERK